MSQYQTGTVDVTNGSQTVTGTATEFLTYVSVGDLFKVTDVSAHYTVAAVATDTSLTLTANWAGSTLTNQTYQIVRDFTPTNYFPEIWPGDKDWPYHLTTALRMIDLLVGGGFSVEDHTTDTTVTLATTDLNKVHLFSNTSTCNVKLPSVDSDNVGSWLEIRKKGTGSLYITTNDSDTIMYADWMQVYNTDSAPTFDHIILFLESATHWSCRGLYGPWETAVSASESPSGSPSESPSLSPSESPSESPSLSPSASESPSESPSLSPSPSESPSESPSLSPSASESPSESPSVSPSA